MSDRAIATVLLATERTEFDAGAERIALALARQLRVRLHAVLPVPSNPEFLAVAPELAARQEERSARLLAELAQQARAAAVPVTTHVRRGDEAWRDIVAVARELQADLLIARRFGKRGFLARLAVGEMVSQVAAHAPCSVLLVPQAAQPWTRRALAVVEGGDAAVVRTAFALLGEARALDVLCIGAAAVPPPAALDAARAAGVDVALIARAGEPQQIVPALARERGAELVALALTPHAIAHGKLASRFEALVGALDCPALLVRS
jgi:nucleotide-binding universal stress UspA family protein